MNINNLKIAVIGLGYVGLPLAVEFGKQHSVVGFDINTNRSVSQNNNKVRHSQADISKIQNALGYAPQFNIIQGIEKAMPWYVKSLKC